MAINKNNYQVYFIDHYEGTLSPKETLVLMAFLDDNPDLRSEFDNYVVEPLIPDLDVTYMNKASLKKQVFATPGEDDEMLIAYMEGDLPDSEITKIQKKIETNARTKQAYERYQATLFIPEMELAYPSKEELKRKTGTFIVFTRWTTYAAAAVIIILIGLSGLLLFNSGNSVERDYYRLSSLEKYQVNYITVNQNRAQLNTRNVLPMIIQPVMREYITIEKMPAGKEPEIIASRSNYVLSLASTHTILFPSYQFMEETETPALAEAQKEKTMAGRIISGVFGKVKRPASGEKRNDKNPEQGNFSFWDIAELGVKSVNAMGDHNYTLVREYNDKGKVKGVMILEE